MAQEKYKTISTKKHASESDPENQKNKKNTRPSSIQQKKQKLAQEKYKTISTKKHAPESDPENQKNKKNTRPSSIQQKKQKLAQEKYKTISTKKHAPESDPENQKNKKNTRPSSIQQKKQKLAQEKYKTISTKKHAPESDPENQKNQKDTRPSSIQQKKQKLAQEKSKTISTKKHASESDPENQKNQKDTRPSSVQQKPKTQPPDQQIITRSNRKKKNRLGRFLASIPKVQKPRSKVVFRMGGVFDSLHKNNEKNGSRTIITSNLQPNLGLKWKQLWSAQWSTFLGLDLSLKHYKKNISPHKTLDNRIFHQAEIHAGIGYSWENLSFINLSFGLRESLFYRQKVEDIYSLQKDQNSTTKFKVSWQMIQYRPFSASVLGQLRHISKGNASFNGGRDHGLGMAVQFSSREHPLFRGSILYHEGDFDSEWSSFEHRWLDFILEYSIDF